MEKYFTQSKAPFTLESFFRPKVAFESQLSKETFQCERGLRTAVFVSKRACDGSRSPLSVYCTASCDPLFNDIHSKMNTISD